MGDFNINLLDVGVTQVTKSTEFFDRMINAHFLPHVVYPTRFTDHSCTLIDHIYCKISNTPHRYNTGIFLSAMSDHCPVFIFIDMNAIKRDSNPKYVTLTQCTPHQMNNYKNDLEQHNFQRILDQPNNCNPNVTYIFFLSDSFRDTSV